MLCSKRTGGLIVLCGLVSHPVISAVRKVQRKKDAFSPPKKIDFSSVQSVGAKVLAT